MARFHLTLTMSNPDLKPRRRWWKNRCRPPPASTTRQVVPRFVVVTVREERAAPLFLPRLLVGLAQGAGLWLLFANRAAMDPYVFSAALMAGLFAPLLLLSGLGRARFAPLLIWTIFAAVLLAAAGAYHHWRTLGSDSGHLTCPLIALSVFVPVHRAGFGGIAPRRLHHHYRSAWRLAIRIILCALFAGLAWAAAGAASGLMRELYPTLPFSSFIIPIVTYSTALAATDRPAALGRVAGRGGVCFRRHGTAFCVAVVDGGGEG